MDLLKVFRAINKLNKEIYCPDEYFGLFDCSDIKELKLIEKQFNVQEMEAFFLTAIFELQLEKGKKVLFTDILDRLELPMVLEAKYYKVIVSLIEKGWVTRIIHNEESIENVRYHKKISVIPYYNEEYKLTKKAVDKIIKKQ